MIDMQSLKITGSTKFWYMGEKYRIAILIILLKEY
jgi:hypothetical protein